LVIAIKSADTVIVMLLVHASRSIIVLQHVAIMHDRSPRAQDTMRAETGVGAAGNPALFGILDGHSGRAASYFCRDELFDYLHHSLATGAADELVSAHAFQNADRHFLNMCWYAMTRDKDNGGLSGACATVCHVNGTNVGCAFIVLLFLSFVASSVSLFCFVRLVRFVCSVYVHSVYPLFRLI
jgi:serine/threonine protein phosphatase PrpC